MDHGARLLVRAIIDGPLANPGDHGFNVNGPQSTHARFHFSHNMSLLTLPEDWPTKSQRDSNARHIMGFSVAGTGMSSL